MRTCVIGGGGFIGSHLVRELLNSGRDVLVLGRSTTRPESLARAATYLTCDYGDRALLRRAIADCGEVIDLAYATVPQTSFANPVFDLQSNLPPSVTLLEEARDHGGLNRVVIVSSGGTVYGQASRLPIIEEDITAPISPYGITKLTIEKYALMFHRLHDVPATIVRPANAYGLGQQPFTGQGFIATAMGRVIQGNKVTVFGEHGTIRDYVHVRDIASGILCALEKGDSGEIYNIGTGVGRSNRDVLDAIEPIVSRDGYSIEVSSESARGFDVPANVLSFGKLLYCSGWQPKVSFDEGLTEMWAGILKKMLDS
ncbi:UDP-glucose 4-epimerase [Methylococcales bacterium]|nr:UDP-glucose 4-epimerase [Methylococcales bacterium]